jgi:hypothetical protein
MASWRNGAHTHLLREEETVPQQICRLHLHLRRSVILSLRMARSEADVGIPFG